MTKNRESNSGKNLAFFGFFNQAKCHTVLICVTQSSLEVIVWQLKN